MGMSDVTGQATVRLGSSAPAEEFGREILPLLPFKEFFLSRWRNLDPKEQNKDFPTTGSKSTLQVLDQVGGSTSAVSLGVAVPEVQCYHPAVD